MDHNTKMLFFKITAVLTDIVCELSIHDPQTDVFEVEYLNKRLRDINTLMQKVVLDEINK